MWWSTSSAAAGSQLNRKAARRSSTAMLSGFSRWASWYCSPGFFHVLGVILPDAADEFVFLGEDEGPFRRRHFDVLIEFFEGLGGKLDLARAEIEGEQGVVRLNVGRGHLHRLLKRLSRFFGLLVQQQEVSQPDLRHGVLGTAFHAAPGHARARSKCPSLAAREISKVERFSESGTCS